MIDKQLLIANKPEAKTIFKQSETLSLSQFKLDEPIILQWFTPQSSLNPFLI